MLYLTCAIIFGIIGAFCAAYWTRDDHLVTEHYLFGAFMIGIFGAAWFITVPIAIIIGAGTLLFKLFHKLVKGEIKFVKDV